MYVVWEVNLMAEKEEGEKKNKKKTVNKALAATH